MLTFGKTCFGTGRSYCCIDNFGVTESCNYFLYNENFVAEGTVLTFGKTGFGTGGGNRFIDNDDVVVRHGCAVLVRIGTLEDSITRCYAQQDNCQKGYQDECFEKFFHFSPSRK